MGTDSGPSCFNLSLRSLPTFCHFPGCISGPLTMNQGHTLSIKIKNFKRSFFFILIPLSLKLCFKSLRKTCSLDSGDPMVSIDANTYLRGPDESGRLSGPCPAFEPHAWAPIDLARRSHNRGLAKLERSGGARLEGNLMALRAKRLGTGTGSRRGRRLDALLVKNVSLYCSW